MKTSNISISSISIRLCAFLLLSLATAAGASFGPLEIGTRLTGKVYRTVRLSTPEAEACQAECEKDGRCKAFTFNKKKNQCQLHKLPGKQKAHPSCLSAIKQQGGATVQQTASAGNVATPQPTLSKELVEALFEPSREGVLIRGGGYRRIPMSAKDTAACRSACALDDKCMGFTLDRKKGFCVLSNWKGKSANAKPGKEEHFTTGKKKLMVCAAGTSSKSAGAEGKLQLFDISPQVVAWQADLGLSADRFQFRHHQLSSQGYGLIDIEIQPSGDNRIGAIWRQDAPPDARVLHDLDVRALWEQSQALAKQGYVLLDLEHYHVDKNRQNRYAGIWVATDRQRSWEWCVGMSRDQWAAALADKDPTQWRLAGLEATVFRNRNMISTLWLDNYDQRHWEVAEISSGKIESLVRQRDHNDTLMDLEYFDNKSRRKKQEPYLALWYHKTDSFKRDILLGRDQADFLNDLDRMQQRHYRPARLFAAFDQKPEYNVVWRENKTTAILKQERAAALLAAISSDDLISIDDLLKRGVDPNTPLESRVQNPYPLQVAVETMNFEAVRRLVEQGAHVQLDGLYRLLLSQANHADSRKIVEYLHRQGLNLKQRFGTNRTALQLITVSRPPEANSADLMDYLIRNGVPINHRDDNGDTVLLLALKVAADRKVIYTLLAHGADINASNLVGFTPLAAALDGIPEKADNTIAADRAALVHELAEAGADVKARTRDSRGVLQFAVPGATPATIEMLLDKGADPLKPDDQGDTPLQLAVDRGIGNNDQPSEQIMKMLVDAGAISGKAGRRKMKRGESYESVMRSEPYISVITAANKGNARNAKWQILPYALAGDPYAELLLGNIYRLGLDDREAAFHWYQASAEAGLPESITTLGLAYHSGIGVVSDYDKAAELYERAIDAGDTTAMINLGDMYRRGTGVKVDTKRAKDLLEQAARADDAQGQMLLADLYLEGAKGLKPNRDKAKAWFRKSAEQGELLSLYAYGKLVDDDELKEAIALIKKAAPEQAGILLTQLGKDYYYAQNEAKNDKRARQLVETAAHLGSGEAQAFLGYFFLLGAGGLQSDTEALHWLEKSVGQNDRIGQFMLAVCYEEGKLVDQNAAKAAELMMASASAGFIPAQTLLAYYYTQGIGVRQDLVRAKLWAAKAVEGGDQSAADLLAKIQEVDLKYQILEQQQRTLQSSSISGDSYSSGSGSSWDYSSGGSSRDWGSSDSGGLSSSSHSGWDYYSDRDWNTPSNLYDNSVHNIPCNLGDCW